MPLFICTACGTQYSERVQAPARCLICEEERQYVPPRGQTWTTLEALRQAHTNTFREYEKGIIGIGSTPAFAIGQRALLVRTDAGNILWDCIATLDDATVSLIEGLGGIDAIAISHPHFYTTMVEWAHAFATRIHLHAADKEWIMRHDPAVELWDGETNTLWDGITLVRCGGHFEGGTALHWAGGTNGRGVICAGDILTVTTDRKWLSFMRSLSEFHSVIGVRGRAYRRSAEALCVRGGLWSLLRPRYSHEWQSRAGIISLAVHSCGRGKARLWMRCGLRCQRQIKARDLIQTTTR